MGTHLTAAGENAILRGAIAELADENEKLRAENEKLRDLLRQIRAWDIMDVTGDGRYWKREIDNALGE